MVTSYATHLGLPTSTVLVRLDGLYGDAAPLLDVLTTGLGVIARSRAYHLLDLDIVKPRLLRAPDHVSTHPESRMARALYDCPAVPLTPTGPDVRLVVAAHPATSASPSVGTERDGTVYELFVSTLPPLHFPPRMSLICICIAARLKRYSPTKMPNRTRIVGTLMPPVARNLPSS